MKHYGPELSEPQDSDNELQIVEHPNTILAQLPEDVQTLVKPYLESRFYLENSNVMPKVVVFTANGSSFRRWLYTWLRTLIENFAEGTFQILFIPKAQRAYQDGSY